MTFSALDSQILGPLFASDEMRAVFGDRGRLAAMLRVEAALAWAQSRFGMVPEELPAAIKAIRAEKLDIADIGAQTVLAGVAVIFLLHPLVFDTQRANQLHAAHLEPDEIVGVVDHTHLVGFGIAHPYGGVVVFDHSHVL